MTTENEWEVLRGNEIVLSRKSNPNLMSVSKTLDEEAWAAHIRETLKATPRIFVGYIIHDVYTVHGDLGYARRSMEIARREIDPHYKP